MVVDAKLVRVTGITASMLCDDDSCSPWSTYYLYQANIKHSLNGKVTTKKIKFVNGQHSPYIHKKIKDWLVILEKVPEKELASELGASYRVVDSSMKAEMYCVDGPIDRPADATSQSDETCYTLEQIREIL